MHNSDFVRESHNQNFCVPFTKQANLIARRSRWQLLINHQVYLFYYKAPHLKRIHIINTVFRLIKYYVIKLAILFILNNLQSEKKLIRLNRKRLLEKKIAPLTGSILFGRQQRCNGSRITLNGTVQIGGKTFLIKFSTRLLPTLCFASTNFATIFSAWHFLITPQLREQKLTQCCGDGGINLKKGEINKWIGC